MKVPPIDLDRANLPYIEELYDQYLKDPSSLDPEWIIFFKGFDVGYARAEEGEIQGQSTAAPKTATESGSPRDAGERRHRERTDKGVVAVVQAYRQNGHSVANIDPLGHNPPRHPSLELSEFGLTDGDLEKGVGFGGFRYRTDGSLKALLAALQTCYCGSMGVDFRPHMHMEQRSWLEERIEPCLNRTEYSDEKKRRILWLLTESEEFEQFLQRRYLGQKRFSIEGGEALSVDGGGGVFGHGSVPIVWKS